MKIISRKVIKSIKKNLTEQSICHKRPDKGVRVWGEVVLFLSKSKINSHYPTRITKQKKMPS